jgi:hypothetical protein
MGRIIRQHLFSQLEFWFNAPVTLRLIKSQVGKIWLNKALPTMVITVRNIKFIFAHFRLGFGKQYRRLVYEV